jgi:uncharacterized membrane protein YebE (DUF533 family)
MSFTLAAVIGLGSMASAQSQIDKREQRQQNRVANGIKNGSLTPGETSRIERDEAKIRRDEARAKSDGVVTSGEKAKLNRELNHTNREIRRDKHNNRHQ